MIKTVNKLEKKIIGLDLDGVILNHTETKVMLAKKLGINVSLADTASDFYRKKIGSENFEKIRGLLYDDPEIGLRAPLMEGAREGLEYLKKSRIPYFLISRRNPPEVGIKLLQNHNLWKSFFDEANTFFVEEKIDKNIKAVQLGINIFVDDEPSVLVVLANVKEKFLMDITESYVNMPDAYYKRVSSWREFMAFI